MLIGPSRFRTALPTATLKVLHPDWWADKPTVAAFVEAGFRELQDEVAKICA